MEVLDRVQDLAQDILDTLDHLGMPELLIKHMPIHQLLQFTTEVHVNKGILRVVLNHLKD